MKRFRNNGFTLIELLIVITILGILTAIAYPIYLTQVQRSGRSDGQAALLNMAALMESYYTENNTYVGATTLNLGMTSNKSQQGYYTLSISTQTATTYLLSATPIAGSQQATDTCGVLTITNTNTKGPSSTCWD